MAVVLIADDEPLQRILARETLVDKLGVTIIEAEDGEQALQHVYTEHPDLVILDVSVPKIDGLEICRRIKADPVLSSIHIVLLSTDPYETAAQAAGCDAFVVKPYDTGQLEAVVSKLLGTTDK
jgi:CheY-like chemotaxis protein